MGVSGNVWTSNLWKNGVDSSFKNGRRKQNTNPLYGEMLLHFKVSNTEMSGSKSDNLLIYDISITLYSIFIISWHWYKAVNLHWYCYRSHFHCHIGRATEVCRVFYHCDNCGGAVKAGLWLVFRHGNGFHISNQPICHISKALFGWHATRRLIATQRNAGIVPGQCYCLGEYRL